MAIFPNSHDQALRELTLTRTSIRGGRIPVPMTVWICSALPAVMFDTVHAA